MARWVPMLKRIHALALLVLVAWLTGVAASASSWLPLALFATFLFGITLRYYLSSRQTSQQLEGVKLELADASVRLEHLFQETDAAVFVCDSRGHFQSINRKAERLSGFSGRELARKSFSDLFPLDLAALRDGRTSGATETEIITKGGKRTPVEVYPLLLERSGRQPRVQMVVHDIAERKRFGQQLWHLASHDSLTDQIFSIAAASKKSCNCSLRRLDASLTAWRWCSSISITSRT